MSVVLPESVPFNDPVTVCSSCQCASCLASLIQCPARKAGWWRTVELPLTKARELALEHPSYWKVKSGDDPDMPDDLEDLTELIRTQRGMPGRERGVLLSYLVFELGIDAVQVNAVMAREWPNLLEIS